MVEHLAIRLSIPLRARNGLLGAAGFAPTHTEERLDGAALENIRYGLELLVEAHDPFPAYVVNRTWDLRLANSAAAHFTAALLTPAAALDLGGNILEMMLHPDGIREHVGNWDQIATILLNRLCNECELHPTDAELHDLLDRVLTFNGVADLPASSGHPSQSDLIAELEVRVGDQDLRFYTAMMTLSDASDITVSELRLETLLPADRATEKALRSLAESRT